MYLNYSDLLLLMILCFFLFVCFYTSVCPWYCWVGFTQFLMPIHRVNSLGAELFPGIFVEDFVSTVYTYRTKMH